MKRRFILCLLIALAASRAGAATTLNATNRHAHGANLGWIDWRGDTNNGAVIGEYVCSGYLWGANVGWIHLGDGSAADGIYYQNNSAGDYGVNHDGFGNLRGLAYGANIGWISFTNGTATGLLSAADLPKVDLNTGKLSGYAYSANCGWISLSNGFAFVQTDTLQAGADTDADGMADAWEQQHFGELGKNPGDDLDGDGISNLDEYLAGTDPDNASEYLRILAITAPSPGTSVNLTWTSVSNRHYYVQAKLDLLAPASAWFDSGLGAIAPDGLTTTRLVTNTNAPMRFYRVEAFHPLMP